MTEKQVQISTIHYRDSGNVTLYETVDISTVRALEEIWYNTIDTEYMEIT